MRSFVGWLLGAAIAAFTWSAACAQPLWSSAEFRDAAIARIRAAEPTAQIRVVDDHMIIVTIPGDAVRNGVEINFERAYAAYRDEPARRDELIDRWWRLGLEPPVNQLTRDRLVVVLRGQRLVESYDTQLRQRGQGGLLTQAFAGDLFVVLAFDTGDAIAYAVPSRIDELGLSVEDAWSVALGNLDRLMGDLRVSTDSQGISYVNSESGLAPSFLLNSEVCRSGAAGELILVTTRDGYVFADETARNAIDRMASIIIGPNRPESRTILSCQDGVLTVEND